MRLENSFIPARGVGEKTERRLWQRGVTHWDDFEDDLLGPTTAENVREFIGEARDRLDAGDADFFGDALPSGSLWRAYPNFAEDACFFDIETTGLDSSRHEVTTVSLHRGGDTRTYVQGEDLTCEALREEFAASSMLVSFNGKRFDQPFLEDCYPLDVTTPHLDLMYLCKRVGLSGGLKSVERDLGIDRADDDVDGREAVRLWQRYDRHEDDAALERLVRYNREDAENLKDLLETVRGRLRADVFESYV
ncbi:ribonuclease H-like domain-containing protein (plasmid) [Halorussus salilacus]|uniref:ribonuclease H-like domain-containing protein n=1 Tax=Halorussus salilacus TaxID=2953750 RepID=UPI00209CC558|nr:ribonuclease H-like domain-containing protein [Halorussus salilacus]USZ70005.1 ribonuclease H-like domain-containing protein [Halorussus salilacus]